jgi:hypothetical protein
MTAFKPYLVGGGVLALLAFIIWGVAQWKGHDKAEQTVGQSACITQVQAQSSAQIEKSAGIDQANAKILSDQVGQYDEKIRALNADNASLAQRLHDATAANSLRRGSVPAVPRSPGELPGGGDQSGPTDCDRRLAEDLHLCALNTIELQSIRSTWQRLSEESKKKGAGVAP